MPRREVLRVPFLLLGLALSGCGWRREPALARVGRFSITGAEFRRKLAEVAPEYQAYVLTPNGRRQFLDVLIREKMILAAASDAGVQKTPEFKDQMGKLRSDAAERLAEGRDYLLTRMWLEDLRKKGVLAVHDDEVRKYWEDHPTEAEVRHILVAVPEEAEALLRKLRSGASLASLAQAKSIDAETAANGGRMRPALYGEIIPELEDVVFKSRVRETVGPIRSKFGYHVLRKESERRLTFQAAEERVRRVLEKQRLDAHLQSVQSRYPVEVFDAQFN